MVTSQRGVGRGTFYMWHTASIENHPLENVSVWPFQTFGDGMDRLGAVRSRRNQVARILEPREKGGMR